MLTVALWIAIVVFFHAISLSSYTKIPYTKRSELSLRWKLLQEYCTCIEHSSIPWWRHQKETFSALLAICAGNSPVPGEFPTQRPMTRSFDVFFDLRPNKRLSKQRWGWWVETPSCPLWRHCNAMPCIKHWGWGQWLISFSRRWYMDRVGYFYLHISRIMPIWAHTGNHVCWLRETETETSLFNTTWHYTDAWYQTYMTILMYYSVLTWYQILACMLGDLC